MNNKLTIDFGFPQIWKQKKKKKKKRKEKGGEWVGEISKIAHPILPQSTSIKKHPPTPPTVLVSTRTLYLRPSFEVISGLIIQK